MKNKKEMAFICLKIERDLKDKFLEAVTERGQSMTSALKIFMRDMANGDIKVSIKSTSSKEKI